MQISQDTFSLLFVGAIAYLVLRKIFDTFREAQGAPKASSDINFKGLLWPYLKAVVAGAVFVFVMWEFLPGSPIESMAGNEPPSWVVRLAVLMSIIPLVMITTPFVLLAGLGVRALKLRRGFADILAGTIGATLGPLGSTLFGPQSMEFGEAAAFIGAFPFAGAIGGFVFWRTLGYPGIDKSTARSVERTRSGAEALSDAADGSILSAGLAAASALKNGRDSEPEQQSKSGRRTKSAPPRRGFGKRAT